MNSGVDNSANSHSQINMLKMIAFSTKGLLTIFMVLKALRRRVATHPLTTPRRIRRVARRHHIHILNIL